MVGGGGRVPVDGDWVGDIRAVVPLLLYAVGPNGQHVDTALP